MYLLILIEDKVKIIPENFNRDLTEAIVEQIEIKYLNKVKNFQCINMSNDVLNLIYIDINGLRIMCCLL
jgi:DNA-directed RNA polymerase subunit E'/Rpb7